MKAGKILGDIVGGSVTIAVIGGIAYSLFALAAAKIQDEFFHHFDGTVQAIGIKLDYKGVEPYNPWPPFPLHDKDGYAEVRLRGNERVFLRYQDLTSLTLEGRIMAANSEGKEAEFDEKNKYDRKTLEDVSELKEALESFGSDKSIREIIEQEIKEAIAKR